MTLDEFLVELKKTEGWRVDPDGGLRATVRTNGRIGDICPVTGVAFAKTKRYVTPLYYRQAAHVIGLSTEDADLIAGNSDADLNTDLRKRLLEACRIPEPPPEYMI